MPRGVVATSGGSGDPRCRLRDRPWFPRRCPSIFDMALRRVATPTKAEAAYVALRDAIRSGELQPGQRVTLQGLAADLQMSLTPVREALRQLAAQGLVEHRANYGTVVTEYTAESAREVYRLRLVLEPLAAELAATEATDGDLAAISAAMRALDEAVAAGRDSEIAQLNSQVHSAIYAAAHSRYLVEFIDRLWHGVPFQAIVLSGRADQSTGEHHDIYAALAAGDGELARERMHAHISAGAENVFRQLEGRGAASS